MTFVNNLKDSSFWMDVLKLAGIFFLLFVGISILISHFSEVISGNFEVIYQEEWAHGQWVNYFLIKAAISFVYAVYMTSRRRSMKKPV